MTPPPSDPRGALHGIRVVEIGHVIAGPFCGHLFADHGADVIKVEPHGGDPVRHWGQQYRDIGLYWPLIGRGKRSTTLDLRSEDGQDALRELLATADVLIENFRPGTLERWGLGWDDLHAEFPRLIAVRLTGYGQTGPYRERAGFGLIAEAMSGFRYLTGEPGRPPVRAGVSIGDTVAAMYGFLGALMALYARDASDHGVGQCIDVALYEAMWSHMEGILPEFEKLGVERQPSGSILPGIAPSNVYPTAGNQWVAIGGNGDAIFARLAAALGEPDWAGPDSPYRSHRGRGRHQQELDDRISAWTSVRSAEEVLEVMESAGVPAGRIYRAPDIAADPHYLARDMILRVPEPTLGGESVPTQGVVPKLSGTPGVVRRGAPILGEHNDEVWGDVLGEERLSELRASGVI